MRHSGRKKSERPGTGRPGTTVDAQDAAPQKTREAVRRDVSRRKRTRTRTRRAPAAVRKAAERPRRTRTLSPGAAELLYRLLLAGVLLCTVFLVSSMYFRVRTIEVIGNDVCTTEAVVGASGVEIGDRLMTVNRKDAAEGILKNLPYADAVRIRRSLPDTLVIEVRESSPAAAVLSEGVAYIIDENCKLLEYMPTDRFDEDILTVEGMTVSEPVLGQTISFTDELRLETLQTLLETFTEEDMLTHVSGLHAERLYDISFTYDDTLTVQLGDATELERKLELLEAVREKLGSGVRGTLELSEVTTARFREGTSE